MTAMRYLALALLVPLLSACEPKLTPAKVEPEKNTTPAVQEVAPVVHSQADAVPIATESAAPATSVRQTAQPVPVKAPVTTPKAPASESTARLKKLEQEPARTKLDLSLPPELAEQLNAGRGDTEQALEPLLPSLFEDKAGVDNPFQLNGRLLSNEGDKDYLKSLEGAEVQFEFRQ